MKLYAKPISKTAEGFEFSKLSEFVFSSTTCRDKAGEQVKKFDIDFLDGTEVDCLMAQHWPLKLTTVKTYLDAAENWSIEDKVKFIIAVRELDFERAEWLDGKDQFDITLHNYPDMKTFAETMIEHGTYSEIPKDKINLETVIEELEADYSQINIDGVNYFFLAE